MPPHPQVDDELRQVAVEVLGALIDLGVDVGVQLRLQVGGKGIEIGDLSDLAKQLSGADIGDAEPLGEPSTDGRLSRAEVSPLK